MSIRNISANARDARNLISSRNNSYNDRATRASLTWKGDIGSAYKNFNRQIRRSIDRVLRNYSNLGLRLDRLDNAIDRAERKEAQRALRDK